MPTAINLTLLLLISLQIGEIWSVCNITALSSVDAITLNKDGKSEYHYGVNFNLMDGYRVIYVTKANVTELCEGIVKFFGKLEELNLIDNNISSVEKNAFQHVPKLKKLSLAVNNLSVLKSGHVNMVKTLEVLYLTSNRLEIIDDDAFDDMINLKRIYLNRNKLKTISSSWFKNCSKLEVIDFTNNEITTIPPRAFTNLAPSFQDDFVQYKLSYNQITEISPDVLDGNKEFLILRLDFNRLKELPVVVFKNLAQVNSLVLNSNQIACLDKEILDYLKVHTISFHLVNNPIECACLDKFDNFVNDNAMQASFYYNTTFNCKLLKQMPVLIN
ncbi:hypothetical protein WA026_023109 [Henosepilachna vigintioctopunctata]|uniref:Uncharacterized protein n=1 Tax=Henosepilachna vigintioctopunctata TaxID=420089 RepID=A0AAW1UEV2_9CUCU